MLVLRSLLNHSNLKYPNVYTLKSFKNGSINKRITYFFSPLHNDNLTVTSILIFFFRSIGKYTFSYKEITCVELLASHGVGSC